MRRSRPGSTPAGAGEPGTVLAVGLGLASLLIRIDRRIDRAEDRIEDAMATFRAELRRLAERRLEESFVRAATKRTAIGLRVKGW